MVLFPVKPDCTHFLQSFSAVASSLCTGCGGGDEEAAVASFVEALAMVVQEKLMDVKRDDKCRCPASTCLGDREPLTEPGVDGPTQFKSIHYPFCVI